MNPTLNPTFKVIVYDNFHYMDESERYELGTFDSSEDALHVAKTIVDEYLASVFEPGMSATDLFESYTDFGEDPAIFSDGPKQVKFSAWGHAKERCAELCPENGGAKSAGCKRRRK